jgi:polyribonucleotide nucleotidyltransferase
VATGSDEDVVSVSFEESFDSELRNELGDLGPGGDRGEADRGNRNDRGRRRHR